eukprot:354470-Chlamydomonas_euryale.AAC.8
MCGSAYRAAAGHGWLRLQSSCRAWVALPTEQLQGTVCALVAEKHSHARVERCQALTWPSKAWKLSNSLMTSSFSVARLSSVAASLAVLLLNSSAVCDSLVCKATTHACIEGTDKAVLAYLICRAWSPSPRRKHACVANTGKTVLADLLCRAWSPNPRWKHARSKGKGEASQSIGSQGVGAGGTRRLPAHLQQGDLLRLAQQLLVLVGHHMLQLGGNGRGVARLTCHVGQLQHTDPHTHTSDKACKAAFLKRDKARLIGAQRHAICSPEHLPAAAYLRWSGATPQTRPQAHEYGAWPLEAGARTGRIACAAPAAGAAAAPAQSAGVAEGTSMHW